MPGKLFIILGAGASVDSHLPTYRGAQGLYNGTQPEDILCPEVLYLKPNGVHDIWQMLRPLYQSIAETKPGPTYAALKSIVDENSVILTQNIDGLARTISDNVIEIHGNWRTMRCISCHHIQPVNPERYLCDCGGYCRPHIILFGESLDRSQVHEVYTKIKWNVNYVLVIGTSLQFPYLREFIGKAKCHGAKVIHINPDDDYGSNVLSNEEWIKLPARQGIEQFSSRIVS